MKIVMSNITLLILADDLTGALDTGIQFASHNISTGVLLSPNDAPPENCPAVLVINTATRHRSPAEARRIVSECIMHYPDAAHVYKKTDSTLRGHIGAELEALMETRHTKRLPFVPAYPDLGRCTRKGYQYLFGKPVHETGMALDPLNPVTSSFIPDIIGGESLAAIKLFPAAAEIPDQESAGKEIFVFDSETTEDLRHIAHDLYEKNLLMNSAGCAGFAEALMEVLPFSRGPASAKQKIEKAAAILFVSGSLHPVSIAQVRAALDGGIFGISVDWPLNMEGEKISEALAEILDNKKAALLCTRAALGEGQKERASPEKIPRELGLLVKSIGLKNGPLCLVIFGGDTLLGIANVLEINYIEPVEEIRPDICRGVVLSRARSGSGDFLIVTKSGAFGPPEIISVILEYLGEHYARI
ncbi:Hrp-dependent type III effector protein [Spirochaetia bacterium]|nr:Hrp-dependent type III effector protein [Spirochaetia bacterium]